MALTGKKRAFADAVLAGFSNKEAAIRAGYSAATASAAGSRLVKDPAVTDYLARHRKPAAAPGAAPELPPVPPRPAFDLTKALQHADPKNFLLAAMNDTELPEKLRIDAAKALLPMFHQKKGEGGKKSEQAEAAKRVASKFTAGAPPRLAAAGGKKV